MTLRGGPLDGNEIEDYDLLPGTTLVFPRIPEDGPIVHDCYLVADDGGKLVGNFTSTEAVPEPVAWPDDPSDQVPALDPVIAATIAAFRFAAEAAYCAEDRAWMSRTAGAVEVLTEDNDMCCPVCEETTCDDGCPLAPVRNRWQASHE
jgi:hypothetical protein